MKALIVLLLLGGCCPYDSVGKMHPVGSGKSYTVTKYTDSLLLYDPDHEKFAWVRRGSIPDFEYDRLEHELIEANRRAEKREVEEK